MLRKILKKNKIANAIIRVLRRFKLLRNSQFKAYKNDANEGRIIYLSDIDHGNLGDHAIIYAMHRLLADREKEAPAVYSFERNNCLAACNLIAKYAKASDLVVIPGGGWIGTVWKASGDLFLRILEQFKESHIVVFPQTITFEDTEYAHQQEKRFYKAISECRKLDLYVRDKMSLEYLRKKMPKEREGLSYMLCPDTVFLLMPLKRKNARKKYCLF